MVVPLGLAGKLELARDRLATVRPKRGTESELPDERRILTEHHDQLPRLRTPEMFICPAGALNGFGAGQAGRQAGRQAAALGMTR
ncbi:hypothetical protein [Streptomyces platensis]